MYHGGIEVAVVERRARRQYYRTKLPADKILFRRTRARARFFIKRCKRASWHNYVSSLTKSTPANKVWKKISKIKGKYAGHRQLDLMGPDGIVPDPVSVANMFGESISNTSRGWQSPAHVQAKRKLMREPLVFPADETEDYNRAFTLAEYENALKHSSNSASGEDRTYYSMIMHLPSETCRIFIGVFAFPQTG